MGKKKKIKKLLKQRQKVVDKNTNKPAKRKLGGNAGLKIFRQDFIRMVYQLSLLGATNQQMADVFGIKLVTFQKWVKNIPDFRDNMHLGKIEADAKVAESMFHNATGFEHEAVKILSNRVKEYGKDGKVVKEYTEPLLVPYKKKHPPNFNAQKHWLAIRQKGIWKDTVEINGNYTINRVDYSDFSKEELLALQNMGMKQLEKNNIEDADFEEM